MKEIFVFFAQIKFDLILNKMSSHLSMEEISVLDRQIDLLNEYKHIPEHEVKALCDKVSISNSC
jgi:hypothetical protein